MPKKNTHKFIDKKNALTFRIVNRSQRDPLIADEGAPQHVLVEQAPSKHDGRFNETTASSPSNPPTNPTDKRKEEQRTFGIFFDDDYDYLQHLKDVGEISVVPVSGLIPDSSFDSNVQPEANTNSRLVLPSSVFASNVEEKIGLLNRGAPIRGPRPDWDPDIVAALDDDPGSDDGEELEDDFVMKANEAPSDEDSCTDDEEELSDEFSDSDGEQKLFSFDKEETKSRFTNYSLTSSVLNRNKGLTLVDDQFEKMFEEYDDDQIGSLEGDESADGYIKPGNQILENAIKEFKQKMEESKICLTDVRNIVGPELYESSTDDEVQMEVNEDEPSTKWDCESIISTYSTLYNHPKLIEAPSKIKVSSSTSIPKDVLKPKGLTKSALQRLDKLGLDNSDKSVLEEKKDYGRPVDETPEEKKERKKAVKEQRRERRLEKKANIKAFKEEKKRQTQIMLNLKQNVQGIKLS